MTSLHFDNAQLSLKTNEKSLTELQILPTIFPPPHHLRPLGGQLDQLLLDFGRRVMLAIEQVATERDTSVEVLLSRVDLRLQTLVVVHQQLHARHIPEKKIIFEYFV